MRPALSPTVNHAARAITVYEARKLVMANPKRYKAAVVEGTVPLRDNPRNSAILFRLVKTAEEFMRERTKALEAEGYKRKLRHGGLTAGIVVFEGPDGVVGLGIDKR